MVLEIDSVLPDNLAFIYLHFFPSSPNISHTFMICASTTQQFCLSPAIRVRHKLASR